MCLQSTLCPKAEPAPRAAPRSLLRAPQRIPSEDVTEALQPLDACVLIEVVVLRDALGRDHSPPPLFVDHPVGRLLDAPSGRSESALVGAEGAAHGALGSRLRHHGEGRDEPRVGAPRQIGAAVAGNRLPLWRAGGERGGTRSPRRSAGGGSWHSLRSGGRGGVRAGGRGSRRVKRMAESNCGASC